MRLSALRPPLEVGLQFHDPGAIAPREREVLCGWLFDIVRRELAKAGRIALAYLRCGRDRVGQEWVR